MKHILQIIKSTVSSINKQKGLQNVKIKLKIFATPILVKILLVLLLLDDVISYDDDHDDNLQYQYDKIKY